MERHQGDLGLEVGRAPRPRRLRSTPEQDEHDRRRRIPALHRGGRQLHSRELLRARPASARDGVPPDRRRTAGAPTRWTRLPQGLRRIQGGRRQSRLGSTDGDSRKDRQGMDARTRDRGSQCDAPDQEDERRSDKDPTSSNISIISFDA